MAAGTRNYDSTRRQGRGRDRILEAAVGLARTQGGWDWSEITFKAVATSAEVSERTIYRHFPTQRELHAAMMERINEEAQISYAGLQLDDVPSVVDRLFRSLGTFTPDQSGRNRPSPAAIEMNKERMQALLQAHHGDRRQAAIADVLWSTDAYERLVVSWQMSTDDAIDAVTWALQALAMPPAPPSAPASPATD